MTFHRRTVLAAAAASASTLILGGRARAASANDRLQLGFIGMGRMGLGHLSRFLGYGDVQVTCVCDVVAERLEHAQQTVQKRYSDAKREYQGCGTTGDFRELLARDDVDAVVIGTPDHWHAIPAIAAMRAGKDVYCEKPLTHNVREGRLLVQAAEETKAVFQTGSQQRSEFGGKFRQAVNYVRSGRLGSVHTVRIGVGAPAVPCDLPAEECPDGTDWDTWLGPAPQREYNEVLCPKGVHKHFPAWRRYREYAGGGLADMGAHHFDIAQWALGRDESGPVKITPPEDEKATSGLKMEYDDGVVMYHGGPSGCTFEGERGVLYVDRGKIESRPVEILAEPLGDEDQQVYLSTDHRRNWVECVRIRKHPICRAEIGHRSATICHLANIGYWLKRPLDWDPVRERFAQDEANELLWRKPREPWTLG